MKRKSQADGPLRPPEVVAAIFEQWQKERPDIDASPVWVFGLLGRVQMEGTALINRALAPLGLTRPSYDVLTALRRAGVPYALTPKQIAHSLLLSASGLTSRINILEEKRLVARMPEPSDRRTVSVQLTMEGLKVVEQAIPLVFDVQRRALETLGADGIGLLSEGLTTLSRQIDALAGEAAMAEEVEG